MNLSKANAENLAYLLKEIGEYLNVANPALLDPEDYDIEKYEDLKFLHKHLKNTGSISSLETEAFLEELSSIRK